MESVASVLRMMSARLKSSMAGPPESMQRMAAAEASAPPLPDANVSFWIDSTRDQASKLHTTAEPLSDVDVAVLGGGIVGITTAYLLRKAGLKVRTRAHAMHLRALARDAAEGWFGAPRQRGTLRLSAHAHMLAGRARAQRASECSVRHC
jgi:hypothetical protein